MKCLFGHQWNGCKCEKCGKTRNEEHKFLHIDGKCVKKCTICGKEYAIEHKWNAETNTCEICGKKKYVIYLVFTVNGTAYIGDIESSLQQKFIEVYSNNNSYKLQDETRNIKGELVYYRYHELIKKSICHDSGIDTINAPLEYIAKETGVDTSKLWGQSGTKLFMSKGVVNISRPTIANLNLNYSVTKYYYERK